MFRHAGETNFTLLRVKFSGMPKWAKLLTLAGVVVFALAMSGITYTLLSEGMNNWMFAGGDLVIYSDGTLALKIQGEIYPLIDVEDWDTDSPNYYHPFFFALMFPLYILYEVNPVVAVLVWWGLLLSANVWGVCLWLRIGERLDIKYPKVFATALIVFSAWITDMPANLTFGNVAVALPAVVAFTLLGVLDKKPLPIAIGCAVFFVTKPMWLTVLFFVLVFALLRMPKVVMMAFAIFCAILAACFGWATIVSGSPEYILEQMGDQLVFLSQMEENYPFVSPDNPNEDGSVGTTNSSWKQSLLQYGLPDISSQIRAVSFALFALFCAWAFWREPVKFINDLKLQLLLGGMFYFLFYQSVAVWMDAMHSPPLMALVLSYGYTLSRRWWILILPAFVLTGWILIYPLVYIIPHKLIFAHLFYIITVYVVVKEVGSQPEVVARRAELPVNG